MDRDSEALGGKTLHPRACVVCKFSSLGAADKSQEANVKRGAKSAAIVVGASGFLLGGCIAVAIPISASGASGSTLTVTTVTAKTPAYEYGVNNNPAATAVCPAGTVVTGGGMKLPNLGNLQAILESLPNVKGNGWVGSFIAGQNGEIGTVYARCVSISG
jgi:hypothetical protein